MDTTLRVMVVGKICGGPITWNPPIDDADLAADIAFDAEPTCSYFAHLMPVDGELQRMIDEGEAASTRFGDMLRAMIGDDDDRYDGSIEDDHDFIRQGGA